MKEIPVVFAERLDDIEENLNDDNYQVCQRIAHDLVNLSWNLELKDEVFVSEVLESIFSNLANTVENYSIPDEKRSELKNQMLALLKPLKKDYTNKDAQALYETLKELRYCATLHQLTAWQKYDKPIKSRRELILGRST